MRKLLFIELLVIVIFFASCSARQVQDPLGVEQGRATNKAIQDKVESIDVKGFNASVRSVKKSADNLDSTLDDMNINKINDETVDLIRSARRGADESMGALDQVVDVLWVVAWLTAAVLSLIIIQRLALIIFKK